MFELKPFSVSYILTVLLLIVLLFGGNYLYINSFKKIEANAKLATEARFGVAIERSFYRGLWQIPAKNLQNYTGSKILLLTKVFIINAMLWMFFAAGYILAIVFLYLFFVWFYKNS